MAEWELVSVYQRDTRKGLHEWVAALRRGSLLEVVTLAKPGEALDDAGVNRAVAEALARKMGVLPTAKTPTATEAMDLVMKSVGK